MKLRKIFGISGAMLTAAAVLLLLTACGVAGQTSAQKQAERQRVAQMVQESIDARQFTIDINYMIPLRGRSRAVNSFSVKVDGDWLDSNLPYFGQAQSVPYGGGKGLTFKEEIAEYTDSGLVEEKRTLVLTVKNEEDTYVYTFTIFDNGSTDLRVHCRNRDDISYRGELRYD